jgi:hypothetical protein
VSPNTAWRHVFTPAGGLLLVQLQHFSTGSPLDRPPTSSASVVSHQLETPTQPQNSQQHDRVGATITGTSYNARLRAMLEGDDKVHMDSAGHPQMDRPLFRPDPLHHVPLASYPVSISGSSAASHPLGLSIATVANVQDPIVASLLMSAQHEHQQSNLFLAAVRGDSWLTLATALQGPASDDGYLGASKHPILTSLHLHCTGGVIKKLSVSTLNVNVVRTPSSFSVCFCASMLLLLLVISWHCHCLQSLLRGPWHWLHLA